MIHAISAAPRFARDLFLIVCLLALTISAQAQAQAKQLQQLATLKSWPGVSQLIIYNGRLWFVNSQPYEDTNAADIYSYALDEAAPRYERSLFSQDVGNPVVYDGLLHWPFEDPRRSAGTGEYAVTDGTHWQWRSMQSGSVMHVHAMNVCNDQLVAVTGSWTGQLHAQQADKQWQLAYDYPASPARFSRLVNVSQFKGRCIVAASANGKPEAKLFEVSSAGIKVETKPLQGWPSSDRVDSLTVHKDDLFAFADSKQGRSLLRYDGTQTYTITLPNSHRPSALHSDGEHLWLATQHDDDKGSRGRLWRYNGKGGFNPLIDLIQAPISLATFNDHVAVGTYHKSGGALWLYRHDLPQTTVFKAVKVNALPIPNTTYKLNNEKVQSLYKDLTALITNPKSTENYASILRRKLARHPQLRTPEFGAALTQLLSLPLDESKVKMFTQLPVTRRNLIRWYLVSTMAINGHGRVDPSWINPNGKTDFKRNGKLFDPAIAAIVATGWLGQNDQATIAALLQRLNLSSDPLWVKADVIGALTALTKQRFAYDDKAWNQWWKTQM